jgi:hypothetical protein
VRECAESRGEKKGARAAGAEGVCDRSGGGVREVGGDRGGDAGDGSTEKGYLKGYAEWCERQGKGQALLFRSCCERAVGLAAEVVCVCVY